MQEDPRTDFPEEAQRQPEALQTSTSATHELLTNEPTIFDNEMVSSPSSQNYQHQMSSGGYPHSQQMSPPMYHPSMTTYSSFRSMSGDMDSNTSTHSTEFNPYNSISGGSQYNLSGDSTAYNYQQQSHSGLLYPSQQQLYYNAPPHALSAITPAYASRQHASPTMFTQPYQVQYNNPYNFQQGSSTQAPQYYHGQQPSWSPISPQPNQQHYQHQPQYRLPQQDFSSAQQPQQYWRSNYRPYQQVNRPASAFSSRGASNFYRSRNEMSANLPNRPGSVTHAINRSGGGAEEAFDRNADTRYRRAETSNINPDARIPGRGLRQHYHTQQGPRSEHVLWCGNVPSDTNVEELWNFFSQLPPDDNPQIDVKDQEEKEKGQEEISTETMESERRPEDSGDLALSPTSGHGVLSVFIIARSNCAFVNYATNGHLQRAVIYFNGHSLRPLDSNCPKLLCRVRKKDDEAQAGVAGQRGRGLHVAWVKEQDRRMKQNQSAIDTSAPRALVSPTSDIPTDAAVSSSGPSLDQGSTSQGISMSQQQDPTAAMSSLTIPMTDETRHSISTGENSSGSLSFTSTNSSLFRHPAFHERFFILKSLGTDDLDRSVATGLWATQPHNEQVLDQAYRNSQSVFLIFSANHSGSFYGYARMTGSILSSEEITQQRQSESGTILPPLMFPSISTSQSIKRASTLRPEVIVEGEENEGESSTTTSTSQFITSPGKEELPTTSPLQLTPAGEIESPISNLVASQSNQSWPVQRQKVQQSQGDLSSSSLNLPLKSPLEKNDTLGPSDSASMDSIAQQHLAMRALINNLRLEERESQTQADQLEKKMNDEQTTASPENVQSDAINRENVQSSTPRANSSDSWGRPFKVDWIKTTPVSFNQVSKLRNPWRDNRQVKVSRDGTELEPNIGRLLLQEWERSSEIRSAGLTGDNPSSSGAGDADEEEN